MEKMTQGNNSRGFTLLEVLIALALVGIISLASYKFLVQVSHQSEVQYDISEMQNLCRTSMSDIRKTVRSAGYMVSGAPIEINGDSLSVYYSDTQPVDTTIYFLREYTDFAYSKVPTRPDGMQLYYLVKQVNSAPASVYADFVTDLSFKQVSPSTILISITTQVPREDDTYSGNEGFRTFSLVERVNVRNAN